MFSKGDTVWVYWGQDNGWWFGAAGGKQGWFPESYVEVRMLIYSVLSHSLHVLYCIHNKLACLDM